MAKVIVPPLGKEGEGSKVAVANKVPSCSGDCCWGTEKGRALRVLPSLLKLPKIWVKRGWGLERLCYPRRQLHPLPKTAPPVSWCGVRDGGHTSLPGLRDCQRSRLRIRGRPRQGEGTRQENLLQLGIKTEQVQRNKTLICTAGTPGQLPTGDSPTKGWPSKKLGKARAWRPSGQSQNSEK